MMDGWFPRVSTRTLAAFFCGVLAVLLLATGASIAHLRDHARSADNRSVERAAVIVRAEAALALSRARSEAMRAVLAAPTRPARLSGERRLASITGDWQSSLATLRDSLNGAADALVIGEVTAGATRAADAQDDVLRALAAGDADGAQRIFVERDIEADSGLVLAMSKLIDGQRAAAALILRDAAEQTRRSFLLLAAAVALVICAGGMGGYALMRRAIRLEADLHRERELSQITLQSINDGVITVDIEGRVEFMNPVAESLTGWRNDEARLRLLSDVYPLIDERSRELHVFEPWRAAAPGRHTDHETPLRLSAQDGREVSIRHAFAPVRDVDGAHSGAIVVFRDDSSLRTLAQQLSWQASHDALTGLANRREFERSLTDLLASTAGSQRSHALLYMDLDHFKAVNDTGGHAAGDELLRQLTAAMQTPMRASDLLARIGGDEFGALLECCPPEQATRIANQIRDAVNGFVFVWQGQQFKVGITIGLMPLDATSGSVAQVIAAADALCYQAKAEGRDRVQTYRPDVDKGRRRSSDARMISQISDAFEMSRFVLYVQPVSPLRVELAGSAHREVLVRMLDARDNLVLPAAFLPAAERYELLPSIDRWALRTLAAHLGERPARQSERPAPAMRHCVNVSSISLQDAEFRAFVRHLIDSHQLAPGQICLELTEVGAMANLTGVADGMHELRAAGCSFALDDFGGGVSSFSFLRYLPIDYLKIEAGFVRDMIDDPMDSAIVDSIARVGHVLGIHTVAQGVDDAGTVEKLQAIGIDYAQGNQFGAPRPLIEPGARPELAAPVPATPLAPQAFNLRNGAQFSAVN